MHISFLRKDDRVCYFRTLSCFGSILGENKQLSDGSVFSLFMPEILFDQKFFCWLTAFLDHMYII